MFRIPSGSNELRMSGFMRTPKEAKTPNASGLDSLRDLTVSSSVFVLMWAMISQDCLRISFEIFARGPLPKKIIFGFMV